MITPVKYSANARKKSAFASVVRWDCKRLEQKMSMGDDGSEEMGPMDSVPMPVVEIKPDEAAVDPTLAPMPPQPLSSMSQQEVMPPLGRATQEIALFRKMHRKRCTYPGNGTADDPPCPKVAASKGLCRAHGGGSRCKVEGCAKFSVRKGMCKLHAKESGHHRTEEQINAGKKNNICTFIDSEGIRCSKQVVTKKLCSAHGGKKRCKDVTDGVSCTKHVFTSGYCLLHARKHGLHHAPDTKRRCVYVFADENNNEVRCTRFSEAHGLCFVHGRKTRRLAPAEPQAPQPMEAVPGVDYVHQQMVAVEAEAAVTTSMHDELTLEKVNEGEEEHPLVT